MERLAMVLKARMRAKKSGFTLVELLIVIMIIAILAGMLLLATGSATDTATATKIINDMRAAKSAALLVYMDSGQTWDWAAQGKEADAGKSLDAYMDRPLFAGNADFYTLKLTNDNVSVADGSGGTVQRKLIGFDLGKNYNTVRIKTKLLGNAGRAGLFSLSGNDGTTYNGTDSTVYMVLN